MEILSPLKHLVCWRQVNLVIFLTCLHSKNPSMETLSPSPLFGWLRQVNLIKFYLVSIKKIPQWRPCLHRHFLNDGDKNLNKFYLVSIKKLLQWRPCLHRHFLDDGDKLTSTNFTLSPFKKYLKGDLVFIATFWLMETS